ncbi:hypothetical protein [Bacteroides caccae]|uniref:hypothetical protein n=1 Tax=Bacteroides caccae TaxID=47678 RepID=UPI0022AB1F06|nr:hypothetical protein [Bacteroides caccae]MCZ2726265.1 hypothetical protein [Bacteroides caccae]
MKLNKEQANKVIAKNESLVIAATYNILFTNDIVCGLIIESIAKGEKSPLYRQRTKQLINLCSKERAKYEKLMNRIIGDRDDFFANANDKFREDIDNHLNILYYSIKQEFDKHKIANSDVVALLEEARTMCAFSCAQFDKRFKELMSADSRFSGFSLEYMRMTALERTLNVIMQSLNLPTDINLNTENCVRAMNIISKKLANGESIARAISV